jgi:ligand-binding SRPBCC domain-containing protein
MITVQDSIIIDAPIEKVFDAERDISLHARTQEHRNERAIGGVTHGLINLGDEVEWEAKHFGVRQRLRVRITHMERPHYFRDEMIKGAFKKFSHEHFFTQIESGRIQKRDVLRIAAPWGPVGYIVEWLFLSRYMKRFLVEKNRSLKKIIEEK